MAHIIPVIDVMGGRVVRAVGGRRGEYKSLLSPLSGTADVAPTARALLDVTGATELYLADLDAITHGPHRLSARTVREVCGLGVPVWVDGGLREDFDEVELIRAGCEHFVVGTETATGANTCGPSFVVDHLLMLSDPDHVALSIDLRAGELLGDWRAWADTPDAAFERMADDAVAIGYRRLIVLDVAAVGGTDGPTTLDRVRQLRRRHPAVELWTGGGVRDRDDLRRCHDAGADAVLVASALHDGTLS